MENSDITNIFTEIADILEIRGGNLYKIRAYRRAALNIKDLSQKLEDIYKEDKSKLREIPGVGENIEKKIIEILTTGRLKKHQELLKKVSRKLLGLMEISGIGPKHLKTLHDKLNVNNATDLERACKQHKVRGLEGFGEISEEKILDALKEYKHSQSRMGLDGAHFYADSVIAYLKIGEDKIDKLEVAGSLRRGQETIGDIDILVSAKDATKVMDKFINYPEAKSYLAHGKTKSSIILKSGIQVDLRNIEKKRFGSALVYFIGSKAHNIHIRKIAKSKGLKINEYGIFKGKRLIASRKEEDIYSAIGLAYIPPELREDRGEIEAAFKNRLPELVELDDIKGDLHIHTEATDGAHTINDMAKEAKAKGYKYIAVTEHSKAVRIAGGLNEGQLSKHIKKIDKENKKLKGIRILKGVEVDIKVDGSLDLKNSILKELDIVIAAIHSKFNMNKEEMTRRLLKAMDNKYVNIIAHPTGRLIGRRRPYEFDFEKVFIEAKKRNVIMEINSYPDRLDLKDVHCKLAKDLGVKFVIITDAHSKQQLDNMKFGVITARRGWLEKKDILNTLEYSQFAEKIKRK